MVNRCDYSQAEVEDWASCGDSVEHLKELLSHNHFIGAFDEAGRMVGFSSMNKDRYAITAGITRVTSEVSLTARLFFEKKIYSRSGTKTQG